MNLIKVFIGSGLFATFIVDAPIMAKVVFMAVAPMVVIIGLVIWSYKMERQLYDRDTSLFEDKTEKEGTCNERFINHLAEDFHNEVGIKIYDDE